MSFDGLFPYARKLATAPLASAKTVQVWTRLAPVDPNNPLVGQALVDQAGTICDLNAYLLMVIAAGVRRIEDMKSAVSAGQAYERDAATGGKDRAWCFKAGSSAQFLAAMLAWSNLPGNGVVQFKFSPKGDAHTFAVERVPFINPNAQNPVADPPKLFRVYQAYEGIYRLADFLGLARDQNAYLKLRLGECLEKRKPLSNLTGNRALQAQANRRETIEKNVTSFREVTSEFGEGRTLSWAELCRNVLIPLKELVGSNLYGDEYAKLTGVPAKSDRDLLKTPKLLVLMCDQVSPGEFNRNYEALPAAGMSMFVDFPQG